MGKFEYATACGRVEWDYELQAAGIQLHTAVVGHGVKHVTHGRNEI
jgi:hypothetical protein